MSNLTPKPSLDISTRPPYSINPQLGMSLPGTNFENQKCEVAKTFKGRDFQGRRKYKETEEQLNEWSLCTTFIKIPMH